MNINELKKLNQKKYRNEYGLTILEGPKFITELERSEFKDCHIYHTSDYHDLVTRFEKTELQFNQFSKISNVENSQGILATVPLHNFNTIEPGKYIFCFDQIQDPGNLGTIIRSAAWFGNISIYLTEGSCDPYNPKVLRSSAGGILHVHIMQNIDLDQLVDTKEHIFALNMDGESLSAFNQQEPAIFVLGNEGKGLNRNILNNDRVKKLRISGSNQIESLNVSTTASIMMNYISQELNS